MKENKNGNECKEGRRMFNEWRVGGEERTAWEVMRKTGMIGVGCLESRGSAQATPLNLNG